MAARRSLEVSEIFTSIQGEGASAGQPCVFLRLAGCNLRCQWCDTRYAWDFSTYDRRQEVVTRTVESVLAELVASGRDRVVVTGGEPLLQQAALATLLSSLGRHWNVEVETNGTLVPSPPLLDRVAQWNVSPKLANSGEPMSRRLVGKALRVLRDSGRAWLKLVVENPADLAEVSQLVAETNWPAARVLLMAQGKSSSQLRSKMKWVGEAGARLGYGLSPRLHIERWGGARGR